MANSHEAPMQPDINVIKEQRMKEILNPYVPSVLVVVDMQNDFVGNEGKAAQRGHNIAPMQAIIPRIQGVEEMFRTLGHAVIRTRILGDVTNRRTAGKDRALFFENVAKPADEEPVVFCLEGSTGAELAMPTEPNDVIIDKRTGSALTPEMKHYIQTLGIKVVYLAGVKTQRCIRATQNEMYDDPDLDIHVVTLEDCIATDDTELHEATLREMRTFYPPVITSERLAQEWGPALAQVRSVTEIADNNITN
jgi:nicotinamidase-related amidase